MFTRTLELAVVLGIVAALAISVDPVLTPATRSAGDVEAEGLFAKAVAAVDQDGKTILTKRAVGHPVVADFNSDGRPDILLGCHRNMDTAAAEILVLLNVGTKAEPKFQWPATKSIKLEGGEKSFSVSCGCKSGGTFEVFPLDYNGDGHLDLMVNTYWKSDGVRVLLNTGVSKTDPTFKRGKKLHGITSHGKRSGWGDWTGDGVMDFAFPVNHYGWEVSPGIRGKKGELTFLPAATMTSRQYKLIGRTRWFEYSPYAWNYSGKHPAGGDRVEVIAAAGDPGNKGKPYPKQLTNLELFILDRKARTVTPVGKIWSVPAALARMSAGDLNGDGSMDLLSAGGVFSKGEETKIWILYGKVKNIPAKPVGD